MNPQYFILIGITTIFCFIVFSVLTNLETEVTNPIENIVENKIINNINNNINNNIISNPNPISQLEQTRDTTPVKPFVSVSISPQITKAIQNTKQQQLSGPIPLDNPPQKSKWAYITLISGIDSNFKYRGFLYNALIMKKALENKGSKADFIAMIGYSENNHQPFISDINLLKENGIIVYELPRYLKSDVPLSFAEMALLKVTPFRFVQYERIQFFDGDIFPTMNMDCFFQLNVNTFTVGAASPLNSGWFMIIPDLVAYEFFKEKAMWRLARDWDMENGWGDPIPEKALFYRGGNKPVLKWDFNGADMDQGLFAHYFILNYGNVLLIDTDSKQYRYFKYGLKYQKDEPLTEDRAISCCKNKIPTTYFIHFTGRSKPWMLDFTKMDINNLRNRPVGMWLNQLDSLHLDINSTNIANFNLKSPLGYFNANFPKGGYKDKVASS